MADQPRKFPDPDTITAQLRQLHLVDQIIGLEAQLAEALVRDEAKRQIIHAGWDEDRWEKEQLNLQLVEVCEHLHMARLEDARLRQVIAGLEVQVQAAKAIAVQERAIADQERAIVAQMRSTILWRVARLGRHPVMTLRRVAARTVKGR